MLLKKMVFSLISFIIIVISITPETTLAFIPDELEPPTAENSNTIRFENSCSEEPYGGDAQDKLKKFREDEASIPERFLVDIVILITSIGNINSIPETIFGNPYCIWSTGEEHHDLVFGIFTESELEGLIKPGMLIFSGVFTLMITLSIMISSIKLSFQSISPRNSAEFGQDVRMWVVSALFMALLWPFLNQLFIINDSLVNSFANLMEEQGITPSTFTMVTDGDYKSMTDVFLHLAEWTLTLVINIVYIARKIILTIVLILAPLSALALLFRITRSYFGIWIKTFISILFIASLHSLIFYIFIMMSQVVVQVESFFFKIGFMIMLIPLTTMLVSWIGFDNSSGDLTKQTGQTATQGTNKLTSTIKQGATTFGGAKTMRNNKKSPPMRPSNNNNLNQIKPKTEKTKSK